MTITKINLNNKYLNKGNIFFINDNFINNKSIYRKQRNIKFLSITY